MKTLKRMLKNNGVSMVYDLKIDDILPYEVFLEINLYPILKSSYLISNYTRVYSLISGRFLKQRINKTTGYAEINLMSVDGDCMKVNIHRILMMTFSPNINSDKYVINHIDGNKLNNSLSNLEWCTEKYNMMHASKHGLLHPQHGETHTCAIISKEKCIEICKLLESRRYTNKKIAEMAEIPIHIVDSIIQKKAWKDVSKDFDLSYEKERLPKIFTYDELHGICKYFQENSKPDDMSLRKHLRNALASIGKDETESALNSLRGLYKKERWKYIYRHYNY